MAPSFNGIAPGTPIGQARRALEATLTPLYGPGEARQMVTAILEDATALGRAGLLARSGEPLDTPVAEYITDKLRRVALGEPLQYVLGYVDWGGLRLQVGPGALIPRPETEWILHRVEQETRHMAAPAMLDLCTGSGCLPLGYRSLRPDAFCAGLDVSAEALQWAHRNAETTGLDVPFWQADILSDAFPAGVLERCGAWQIITSNPPYVPLAEKESIALHVREHEPELALFVPDQDPLLFYRRVTGLAREWLAPGGLLFFESHVDYAPEVAGLMRNGGFSEAVVEADPYGRPRLVWGCLSGL